MPQDSLAELQSLRSHSGPKRRDRLRDEGSYLIPVYPLRWEVAELVTEPLRDVRPAQWAFPFGVRLL